MLPSVINMSHFDYNCRWVNKIMKKGEKSLKLIVTFPLSKTSKWSKSQKKMLDGVYVSLLIVEFKCKKTEREL